MGAKIGLSNKGKNIGCGFSRVWSKGQRRKK
jgi:hypothetical protein